MKNDLTCDVVADLLPGYVDNMTSEQTNEAVKKHLSACEACSAIEENMRDKTKMLCENPPLMDGESDKNLFKKINRKLNKKAKITVLCSVAAIIAVVILLSVLFNAPLKSIDISEVSVSAKVYPFSELEKQKIDDSFKDGNNNYVAIYSDEDDNSDTYKIVFPDNDNMGMVIADEAMSKSGYVTAITWSCPYFLREIRYAYPDSEESGVIYVCAFKTTLLNNKAEKYNSNMVNLEMREINKIVFVSDDGAERVLWENK